MNLEEITAILSKIGYEDLEFVPGKIEGTNEFYLFIQCRGWEEDNVTGKAELFYGRKWLIPTPITRTDVVNTAFKAVSTWEEHEIREKFKYKGKSIFQPHYDPDELAELTEF